MIKKPPPKKENSKVAVLSIAQELNVDVDLRRLHEACSALGDFISPFMKRVKVELQAVKDGEQTDVPRVPLFLYNEIPYHEIRLLFSEILPLYPFLRVIQLHHCAVRDDGVLVIVEFLRTYKPSPDRNPFGVQCLELPGCMIGPVGGKYLGKLLGENDTIIRCVLDFNPLGDAGARALSNGIRWNGSLEDLSMQYCGVESSGGEALAEAVLRCSNVRIFSLRGNVLGPDGIKHIGAALGIGNRIEHIDVADTRFGGSCSAVEALCQGIENSGSLTTVDMDLNVISPEAAQLISTAVLKNKRLVQFRVYERVDPGAFLMVQSALEQNRKGTKKKKKREKDEGGRKHDVKYQLTTYKGNLAVFHDSRHAPPDQATVEKFCNTTLLEQSAGQALFATPFDVLLDSTREDSSVTSDHDSFEVLMADIGSCVAARENVTIVNRGTYTAQFVERVLRSLQKTLEASAENAMQIVADEIAKEKQMQRLLQLENETDLHVIRDVVKAVNDAEMALKGGITIKCSAKLSKNLRLLRLKHPFSLTSGKKHNERFTLITASHHEELLPPCAKGSCLLPQSFMDCPPLRCLELTPSSNRTKNSCVRNSYLSGRTQRRSTFKILDVLNTCSEADVVEPLKGNGWGKEIHSYFFNGESSVLALPGVPKFEDIVKGFMVDFWFRKDPGELSTKRVVINIMDGQRADLGQLFQISLKHFEELGDVVCVYVRDSTNRVLECVLPLPAPPTDCEESIHHFLLNVVSLEEGNLECIFDGEVAPLQIVQQEYPIFFNAWLHRLFVGGYMDENNTPTCVFQGTIFYVRFGQGTPGNYKPIVIWPLLDGGELKEITRNIPTGLHQTLLNLEMGAGCAPSVAPSFDGNLVVNMGHLGILGELLYNWRLEVKFRTTVNSRAMSLLGVTDRQCRMQELGIVLNAEPMFGKERFRFHESSIALYLVDAYGACCSALLRGSEHQNLMDGQWHTIVWKCIDSEANTYRVKVDGVSQELLYLVREGPRRFLPFVDWVCLGGHSVRSWKVKRPFCGEIDHFFVSVRGVPLATLNMNEGPGAYVMQDASGRHNHGLLINPITNVIRRHDVMWYPLITETSTDGLESQGKAEIVIHRNNVVSLAAVVFTCEFTESGVAHEAVFDLFSDESSELEVVDNHISDMRPEWKTWRALPKSCFKKVDSLIQFEEAINSILAREKPMGHFMFVIRIGDCHVTFLNLHGPTLPKDAIYNRNMLKWQYAYSVSGTKGRRELLLLQMMEGVESVLQCDTLIPFTAVKLGPLNSKMKGIVSEELIRSMQNRGKPWYLCAVLHNHLLNAEFGSHIHVFNHFTDSLSADEAASIALFNKRLYDTTKEKASLMIQRNWKAWRGRQDVIKLKEERQIRERKIEEIQMLRMNPNVLAKEKLTALLITLHTVQCEAIRPISDDILNLMDVLQRHGYEVTHVSNPDRVTLVKALASVDDSTSSFVYVSGYGGPLRVRQPLLFSLYALHIFISEGARRAAFEYERGRTLRALRERFREEFPPPKKSGKAKKGEKRKTTAPPSKKALQEEEMAARQREEMHRIAVSETEHEEAEQRAATETEYAAEVLMIVCEMQFATEVTAEYERTYKSDPKGASFVVPCETKLVEPFVSALYNVDEILEMALKSQSPPMGLQRVVAMDLEPLVPTANGMACIASSTGHLLRIPYLPQQRRVLTDYLWDVFEGHIPCVSAHSKYAILQGGIETPEDQRDWRSLATYVLSKMKPFCSPDVFAELRGELDREVPFTSELIPVRGIKLDVDQKLRRDMETKQVNVTMQYAVGSSQVQSDMFSVFRGLSTYCGPLKDITFKNALNIVFTNDNKGIDGLLIQSVVDMVEKCRPSGCTIDFEIKISSSGASIMFRSRDPADKLNITHWTNSIVVQSLTWSHAVNSLFSYRPLEVGLVEYLYELRSSCSVRMFQKLVARLHAEPSPAPNVRFLGCEGIPV